MDRILVASITVVAFSLFLSNRLPIDLVALLVLVALAASGVLTPDEALLGFASPATLTVLAMLVLGGGLERTGATAELGRFMNRVTGGAGELRAMATLMVSATVLSAFVNNTAVVTVLMPVAIGLSVSTGIPASKLLIPLSFGSIFGGTLTLIGTSTNLVVDSVARRMGVEGFSMFEFAPLGAAMALAGTLYMLFIGQRLLPGRKSPDQPLDLAGGYTTEVEIDGESSLIGRTLVEINFEKRHGVEVVEILRGRQRVFLASQEPLQAADVLVVRGPAQSLLQLQTRPGVNLRPDSQHAHEEREGEAVVFGEAVVSPTSRLRGRTLEQVFFRHRYELTILALNRRGEALRGKLSDVELRVGDMLLLKGPRERLAELAKDPDFLVLGERSYALLRRHKLWTAVAVLALVVALPALGIAPIVITALGGMALMVLLGCLTMQEAYDAVDWSVVFLLACLMPLGLALERTGIVASIAEGVVASVGTWGPWLTLAAIYLLTSVLTELLSNAAVAIFMTPIALATAASMGVDGRPFLFAIAFGASANFMTPVGYQTHMMVFSPGGYRYADFLRVGAPLNLLLWLVASALIPILWPFHPDAPG